MAIASRRSVLQYRRGTTSSARRHKAFGRNSIASTLLLAITGGYILLAGTWLTPPQESEHQSPLDLLRKEQEVRRQRLARLHAEAKQYPQEADFVQKRGERTTRNDAKPARLPAVLDRENAANDLNVRVAETFTGAGDDIDDNSVDDNSNDDVTAEQQQTNNDVLNKDQGTKDDDIAVQERLADAEADNIPMDAQQRIAEIRRRMDEQMRLRQRELIHDPPRGNLVDHFRLQQARQNQEGIQKVQQKDVVDEGGQPADKNGDNNPDGNDKRRKKKGAKGKPKTIIETPRKLPKIDRLANLRSGPIEGDPLRATKWEFPSKGKIAVRPSVPYLGTLVDAGRHYFSIEWLKRLIDRLSDMNYNLIHLRLTDDQTFNVLLKSRPQLAYPTALDNPGRKVYSPEELRDLTAYAKARNISIMPEVNVPGHAGSWAGIPDMIVHCPGFICEKGYGLPLNVTHHELKPILTDVIKEIVDIFDDPPFLHLGGDEANMADPCFHEVGHEVFDYPAFEVVLKEIIKDSGYPEDRVVRWEMTGQANLNRAGSIEHFWESHPGVRHEAKGAFFVSTWLYCDTNNDQNAYDLYTKTIESFKLRGGVTPTAIIVGTFELHAEFWYDRNILGRLLAVAIGASSTPETLGKHTLLPIDVVTKWNTLCNDLGFGEIICDTEGQPVIATRVYHEKWRQGWEVWKGDICQRLTTDVPYRMFRVTSDRLYRQAIGNGNQFFWLNFPLDIEIQQPEKRALSALPPGLLPLEHHTVQHVGVILDAVRAMPTIHRLHSPIQDYVVKFGLNTVQLRLISDSGWVYESETHPRIAQSLISGPDNPLYSLRDIEKLVVDAGNSGVQITPEIATTTDAGGWINTQFLVDCPDHFCSGQGMPVNINDEKYLPVLFSVVGELRKIFNSKYIHLGSDERDASAPCFQAADVKPAFSAFERKLETLMALADIAPGNIIRNENVEGIRYSDRTGEVTQYSAGVTDIREGEPAFLTVDIFDGDAYNVFQNTQKAANLKPLGVLAELRKLNQSKWAAWHIAKRLLAFAMGVSELGNSWSIYDAASFNASFTKLCQDLELEEDCTPPGEMSDSVRIVTDGDAFIKKNCEVRTQMATKRVAIPVKPFYEVTVSGEATAVA